ncbi:hypothetical protein PISMIDRAFT_271311 [Pisolithus microcarpus 441]|uniref:Uncharacterized protein n=1 Tax=Pisolithus microcarpus 441 TaxID=765257 RepID=A0A0C9YMP1_9AGAM|nr:hypothetical protein PISMIDRAFT_271311 [Pisolithus microcarpus 441]
MLRKKPSEIASAHSETYPEAIIERERQWSTSISYPSPLDVFPGKQEKKNERLPEEQGTCVRSLEYSLWLRRWYNRFWDSTLKVAPGRQEQRYNEQWCCRHEDMSPRTT